MAKKTLSLVDFAPTAEELQAARTLLKGADAKMKKSKVNSMNQFLSANANDGNTQIAKTKAGPEKTEYIAKYIAYQSAKKSGRLINTMSNISEDLVHNDFLPMNYWKMCKEFGDKTADAWIAHGIDYDPDPVTNSSELEFRVYKVPQKWTRKTTGQSDKMVLEADGSAGAEEIANFESMRGSSGSGGTGTIPIKEEPKTKEELAKIEGKEFVAQSQTVLSELNSAIVHLKLLEATAKANAMTIPIAERAKHLCTKTGKVAKAVEQLVVNADSVKDNGLVVLMQSVKVNRSEREDLNGWAEKLDVNICHGANDGGRKKRKRA